MAHSGLHGYLEQFHRSLTHDLQASDSCTHPVTKGAVSEAGWLRMLQHYLPKRYEATSAFVIDSRGTLSEQIDIVIFDRQYSPFIFEHERKKVIPAESVYAVFEVKQSFCARHVGYAHKKVASVRRLLRTSVPIPHAGGTYPGKEPFRILGGLLASTSEWRPPLGDKLEKRLTSASDEEALDLGCCASEGIFVATFVPAADEPGKQSRTYELRPSPRAATAFFFELLSALQQRGTVPMLDVQAYAQCLDHPPDSTKPMRQAVGRLTRDVTG